MVLIGLVGKLGSQNDELVEKCKNLWDLEIIKLPDYNIQKINEKMQLNQNIQNHEMLIDYKNQDDNIQLFKQIFCKYWNKNCILYPITTNEQVQILKSRNYFHLIYLDTPSKQRYEYFVQKYKDQLQNIDINFDLFMQMDDFIYYDSSLNEVIEYQMLRIQNNYQIPNLLDKIPNLQNDILRPFRPEWKLYFMKIAHIVKSRSNCMKRGVGAIIVKSQRLISTGYNGTPGKFPNCYEGGCDRCNQNKPQGVDLHTCFCIHAEESAILEAGIHNLNGSDIYTTLFPCIWCTKLLISAQIKNVYYDECYDDNKTQKFFDIAGITCQQIRVTNFMFSQKS